MPPKRIESLDGFRGVCALFVAVMHCDVPLKTGHLLNHAYLGVDAFFVLSGFVIARTYENRLKTSLSLGAFLRRRLRRLVPVHWIGTAVVAAVVMAEAATGIIGVPNGGYSSAILGVVFAFLLLPDLRHGMTDIFPINNVLWSLTDEWIVNIAYARLLFRGRILWLAAIVLTSWAMMAVYGVHSPVGLHFGIWRENFLLGVLRALAGFLGGVVVFRLHRSGLLKHLPSLMPELVYALFMLACAIPTLGPTPNFDLAVMMLLPLGVALLVRSDRAPPRIYVWLGAISYPLYVSQMASIHLAYLFLDPNVKRHSVLLAIPMMAGVIVVAWMIAMVTTSKRPITEVSDAAMP